MGQHHRHLQEDAEEVADVVGAVLGKALGAIAALQQEGLAARDLGEVRLELARLAGKDQRRERLELRLGRRERLGVRIVRHLRDRLLAPAIAGSRSSFVASLAYIDGAVTGIARRLLP